MSTTSHVAFFGDLDHTFDLARPEIVRELEAATGVGIGGLFSRVCETRSFWRDDLEHVLRLGLVGGGLPAQTASRLVANYLPLMPLGEAQVIAMAALSALWFGALTTPVEAVA